MSRLDAQANAMREAFLNKVLNYYGYAVSPSDAVRILEQAALAVPLPDHSRLVEAVRAIYYSACWHPDRTVDGENAMWTELRDAAGFAPGQSPTPVPLPPTFEAQCPDCGGDGRVPVGEHYVSHEMALDAGQPERAGESMGVEYGPCPRCHGAGKLKAREVQDER